MAEEERRYRIPVVFEVASSGEREQAARVLHALLTSWGDGIHEVPILDEHGAPTVPIQSWWFPEPALKHVDGNTREAEHLRSPNAFIDEYEDTPVIELLAEAFPEAPNPENYHTANGERDEDAWGVAFDNFTGEALDLAIKVTRIDEIVGRLERAETLRDSLADMLERTPLPEEPQRQDYLVTVAPRYSGEIDGSRYDWDYAGWQGDFNAAALIREQELRRLLTGAGGRSTPAAVSERVAAARPHRDPGAARAGRPGGVARAAAAPAVEGIASPSAGDAARRRPRHPGAR